MNADLTSLIGQRAQLTGNVLITGGAGFLGRGILRRAYAENWPCNITVVSRDEHKQDLCRRRYKDTRYILGDIRDTERMSLLMHNTNTVIHTAALKYIPEAEHNVSECISVNVDGTASIITAARNAEVALVVGLSTDKATEPINVYGMTKALNERMYAEAASYEYGPTYIACRYGNVIGSTGSVIPLFLRQLATTGRVTITDQDMTRFWITINDAIDLVLEATNPLSENGTVIIPDPYAMTIGNLARCLTDYHKIDVIGVRPGERRHELLITNNESHRANKYCNEYYCLWPTINNPFANLPITPPIELSSRTAKLMSSDDMKAAIEDAQYV